MIYKWDIIGHETQISQLEREIETGNISHAYLFSGPKDVGKFRVARIFANILQCPHDFCRRCKDCQMIANGTHLDTLLVPDDGSTIHIDEVRELIRKTNLTAQSRYRLIVIENIERMPIEAQNSFLKTLEEPPGRTVFLLTSTKVSQVLPTILSRVRLYEFSNVDDPVLETYLRQKFGDHTDLSEIIEIAQGRPGLAIHLIKDPVALSDQRNVYRQIDFFLKKNDLAQKFQFVESVSKGEGATGKTLELFFDAFSRYLRKLLFDYMRQKDHPLRARFTLKEIADLFESLEKTRYLIDRNVNLKLALENLFLQTEK
ncbi:DNA polymerase III subunit [Candidatus Peregrinibacteria bacterium]|nr:DNA polymerase III subunit [Candidatus Peregrinibacteria bacterium]